MPQIAPAAAAACGARAAGGCCGAMPASREFLDHVADQLRGFRPFSFRRMFSGAGIFRDGLMFGLVARDALYFKVGDANRAAYLAAGAKPFTYQRLGAPAVLVSYYEVPAAVFDDPDALAEWARAAYSAARAKGATAKRKSNRRRA
jgi:DNA transformation protein and related proteins